MKIAQRAHLPTLGVAIVVVLGLFVLYHLALGRRKGPPPAPGY